MDLQQLTYFLAIADHGGFSKAARALEIAQPSLSEQVKRLERALRRPLFDRLPRGVVLTEAGRVLAGHARRLLAGAEAARRDVAEAGGRVAGTLRVGAIPTIAPFLLPGVLRAFIRAHPDVRLSVTEDVTTRLLTAVADGAVDLAIVSTAVPPPAVSIETLAREPLLAALPAGHPLAARPTLRPCDLEGQRMLVLKEMHCLAQQVAGLCPLHAAGASVTLRGEQLSTIAAMIEAGLGVSVVPAMMAAGPGRPGIAYRPLIAPDGDGGGNGEGEGEGVSVDRPVCVATSPLRHRGNAAGAFLDALRPACAALCPPAATPNKIGRPARMRGGR